MKLQDGRRDMSAKLDKIRSLLQEKSKVLEVLSFGIVVVLIILLIDYLPKIITLLINFFNYEER